MTLNAQRWDRAIRKYLGRAPHRDQRTVNQESERQRAAQPRVAQDGRRQRGSAQGFKVAQQQNKPVPTVGVAPEPPKLSERLRTNRRGDEALASGERVTSANTVPEPPKLSERLLKEQR